MNPNGVNMQCSEEDMDCTMTSLNGQAAPAPSPINSTTSHPEHRSPAIATKRRSAAHALHHLICYD